MYTYNPKELVVLANGIALSDFAEDSFIEITPVEEELYTTLTGANGTSVRTLNSNTNYTCKMSFLQGSTSAKLLLAYSKYTNGNDVFNFTLQDPASADEFLNCVKSYVHKRASASRGKVAGTIDVELMLINPINNFI